VVTANVGISGFAAYLPSYRVQLEDWCRWTDDQWDKVRQVVGSSYRMCGPNENAYTMAATAVLRLIDQHRIDPQRVRFLALGTESSTDNSAGAVIVRGMVDQALVARGDAPLNRACEVPEFKHACLGGVYALKAAARYVALDGAQDQAIVVCSDIAEYERATSGEQTQGAGAVAMLVERNPRLLEVDLALTGSASAYRGPDFRKPFLRFMTQTPGDYGQPRDYPVFNGRYSTTCYVDEVLAAMRDLFTRLDDSPAAYLRSCAGIFLHRPYQRMAETGVAFSYLLALAHGNADDRTELAALAAAAELSVEELIAELDALPDVFALVEQEDLSAELYPMATACARHLRKQAVFAGLMTDLGTAQMRECGNLYTASLPAWLAAGLEEAAIHGIELTGQTLLTVGYGSGNAAEIIPMRLVPDWQTAASRTGFRRALADGEDLDQQDYATLHDDGALARARSSRPGVFYIDRVGRRDGQFDDYGIEYYRLGDGA